MNYNIFRRLTLYYYPYNNHNKVLKETGFVWFCYESYAQYAYCILFLNYKWEGCNTTALTASV